MITLPKEELAEALKGFRLLKRKKGATKAPLTILVEPGPQEIRLAALCLANTLTYTLPATQPHATEKPFRLNAVHLEEAAKGADRRTGIRIDNAEKVIRYRTKGVDIAHAFHPVTDEPDIQTDLPEGQNIPLPDDVMATITEATVCASTDESRYILNGVLVEKERIAATNGRKLYSRKIGSLPLPEKGIVLPLHPVWKLFSGGGTAMLRLGPVPKEESLDRRFQLSLGPWTWSTFLVRGNYPNYRQVIPKEDETRICIEIAEADAGKLIEVLPKLPGGNETDGSVTLDIQEECVAVIAENDGSESRVVLDSSQAPAGAGPIQTCFNRTFLREALQLGFRVLNLKDELSSVHMEDRKQSRLFLWMPLRPQAAAHPAPEPSRETTPAGAVQPNETSPEHHNRLSPIQAGAHTSERNSSPMTKNGNESPVPAPVNGTNGSNGSNGTNGTNGHHERTEDPVAQAREGLTRLREMLRDLNGVVQGVNASLREAERDHKALEKEHRSLRKNLRGLQSLDV